jgi:hypothetical protein
MPGGYMRGWTPLERVPDEVLNPAVHGEGFREAWINDRYEVFKRTEDQGDHVMVHLSIKTLDRSPVRNWRHLQQMKNEVCGEGWTGVEFFPPEHLLVDTANQYHLFCFPPEVNFGFAFGDPDQSLVTDDETVEEMNNAPNKVRQEPWEDGLTTGRTEASAPARARMRALKSFHTTPTKGST